MTTAYENHEANCEGFGSDLWRTRYETGEYKVVECHLCGCRWQIYNGKPPIRLSPMVRAVFKVRKQGAIGSGYNKAFWVRWVPAPEWCPSPYSIGNAFIDQYGDEWEYMGGGHPAH